MPATLPTVRSGAVALYPLTRSVGYAVDVARFQNGAEQRFKIHNALAQFGLTYNNINATDRNSLLSFFASVKGALDSTWQFTLNSTYPALCFEDDAITFTENTPLRYSTTLKVRQTGPGGAATAAGTAYPMLAAGVMAQLPYTQTRRFLTDRVDLEAGPRVAWGWYGTGLGGFPTGPLYSWTLDYSVLPDADVATLEAFFALQYGRYGTFSFTDPDLNTVYSKVRFDMDSLDIRHVGPNQTALTVKLAQIV